MAAAHAGQLDAVGWLLGHGAAVTLRSPKGFTALHFAARAAHLDVLMALSAAHGREESAAAAVANERGVVVVGKEAEEVVVYGGLELTVPPRGWSRPIVGSASSAQDDASSSSSSSPSWALRNLSRGGGGRHRTLVDLAAQSRNAAGRSAVVAWLLGDGALASRAQLTCKVAGGDSGDGLSRSSSGGAGSTGDGLLRWGNKKKRRDGSGNSSISGGSGGRATSSGGGDSRAQWLVGDSTGASGERMDYMEWRRQQHDFIKKQRHQRQTQKQQRKQQASQGTDTPAVPKAAKAKTKKEGTSGASMQKSLSLWSGSASLVSLSPRRCQSNDTSSAGVAAGAAETAAVAVVASGRKVELNRADIGGDRKSGVTAVPALKIAKKEPSAATAQSSSSAHYQTPSRTLPPPPLPESVPSAKSAAAPSFGRSADDSSALLVARSRSGKAVAAGGGGSGSSPRGSGGGGSNPTGNSRAGGALSVVGRLRGGRAVSSKSAGGSSAAASGSGGTGGGADSGTSLLGEESAAAAALSTAPEQPLKLLEEAKAAVASTSPMTASATKGNVKPRKNRACEEALAARSRLVDSVVLLHADKALGIS